MQISRPEAGLCTGDLALPDTNRLLLRAVIDGIQQCNLRCLYCHPGEVWQERHLDAARIRDMIMAAERSGLLEVVISGGEIGMHPQFADILQATGLLRRTASTLITNATLIDDVVTDALERSGLTRICVSIDGIDNATHGSARGKNLDRVIEGLRRINTTGKPVTVITVTHRQNWRGALALSEWLAETGLAEQHHLCAPSYSGEARAHYDELKLGMEDFFALQQAVDDLHDQLRARRLFVTFNSFWPATGQRSPVVEGGRSITLQQLSEQVKDSLVHVRPNGDLRLAAASWGRETIGNAVVGNVNAASPADLLAIADQAYRGGQVYQLSREAEAMHKFQLGSAADQQTTNALIDKPQPAPPVGFIPIQPLSSMSLLDNPLNDAALADVAAAIHDRPGEVRCVQHASGVHLVFDRHRSHVTLLKAEEWAKLTAPGGMPDEFAQR